jgi:hypothetical protein
MTERLPLLEQTSKMLWMKILIFVFGFYAVLCAFGAITGIQAYHGGQVIRYHDWQRVLPIIFAPASAAICYGLLKRRLWSWRVCLWLGYLMVAQIVIFNAIIPTIRESEIGMRLWIAASQILFAGIVYYVVKKWWLPKKALFSAGSNVATDSSPS